jgi:protein-S-isoprenylcysteine O-methyltransferase Ste14
MAFPKGYAEFVARRRVAAGFVVAAIFLFLAEPTAISLFVGLAVGVVGLLLRGWAAGHLAKYESLSTSGPFAYTRNPLYLGTLLVGVGFAIAGAHIAIGALLIAFFLLFYLPVIEEEESYLIDKFPGYNEYCERVPRLWPRLRPQYIASAGFQSRLYRRNREYQALAGFMLGMVLLAAKHTYLT